MLETPIMADEQGGSFIPGPLDELVPGLRIRTERLPALAAHPRGSRVTNDAGEDVVVLASFAPIESARALHQAFKPIVEAALLSILSQPQTADLRSPVALELYTFAPFPFAPDAAFALFGFVAQPLDAHEGRRALALLRREALLLDGQVSDEPLLRFRATLHVTPSDIVRQTTARLRAEATGTPWGTEPGALARRLAVVLHELSFAGVEPSRAGIERLESILVSDAHDVIRWLDPLCFQALCDLVAVAAHNTWGANVEWAVCEVDTETSLAPPPLIRVYKHSDRSSGHVPLGEHILRWCMMPRRAGEDIPTLGAWAEHEFT